MIANANSISIPMVDQSVHCVVTSPPYWGLRDYGLPPTEWPTVTYTPMAGLAPVAVAGCDPGCAHGWADGPKSAQRNRNKQPGSTLRDGRGEEWTDGTHMENPTLGSYCQLCGGWRGCLGLEPTPEMFVGHIIAVFREVWRVLRDDGTLWINFGDSYNGSGKGRNADGHHSQGTHWKQSTNHGSVAGIINTMKDADGLKPKDLCGIPWRVAFALQADGWYLRNDIIWHKPNPMPESVTDRCTKSHEYLFLLSKKQRYYYDNEAVKETSEYIPNGTKTVHLRKAPKESTLRNDDYGRTWERTPTRNRRTVWTANPQLWQLRADLSDSDRAYVLGELVRQGLLANTPNNNDDRQAEICHNQDTDEAI